MKITAEKLDKIIHDITKVATKIHSLEIKMNSESKLAKQLHNIALFLNEIRQEILFSINYNEEDENEYL